MSAVQTRHHFDHVEKTHTWERVQDVEPYLEQNKNLQSESQGFAPTFHQIASIPCIFIEKWMNEAGVDYREIMCSEDGLKNLILRKVRDPDYAFLRTTDKRF
jgi:hypothetical protein